MTAHRTCFVLVLLLSAGTAFGQGTLHDPRETHLADVVQLTHGGENAEAYWSFDGSQLIFQKTLPPEVPCDQIYRLDPNDPDEPHVRVSNGLGRTTCAYFMPGDERVLYATTHKGDPACPPKPDFRQGYVWPIYPTYEIVTADPDGSNITFLTDNDSYDAEGTVCGVDGSILFTSMRDDDLELYRMDADGSNVTRLTDAPGYDGGAFFNDDCTRIVWRASRPTGDALADYQRLLKQDMIRPGKLEIWVANADGSDARQVTYLGGAAFAPFFHPSGDRILFSSSFADPRGREFDIWAIDTDGTDLERITFTEGFDGFPMFSPDGTRLAFASNRNQGKPGETDVYVARWIEHAPKTEALRPGAADRYLADIAWLADDAREGRGVGTAGLVAAADWLETSFRELGLAPGYGDGYRQGFDVTVAVSAGDGTAFSLDGTPVETGAFRIASFADAGEAEAEVVPVGYGISAADLGHDDYAHVDVTGKIVLVRRYLPPGDTFAEDKHRQRYGDLRYKAWNAREHGAAGVVLVDLPDLEEGAEMPDEAPLPRLTVDAKGNAGLPVVVTTRAVAAPLFAGGHHARMVVAIESETEEAHNIVAKLPATGTPIGGPIVIGAHYDHLGFGGAGSLSPDTHDEHNGADDNASGTAALLEIARGLLARHDTLRRDVYLVAFSAEESGLLGSTAFTKTPPPGLETEQLMAMINLDMIGRLRDNRLSVLGSDSATEWNEIVPPACTRAAIDCTLGGDGYGPSDQTPFYAAGVPVLHLFTGAHLDYHKPSDDTAGINAWGGVQIASLVTDLTAGLAAREDVLTYVEAEAPAPRGDARSYGASLGTIPDYADDQGGVLLAGVRPGSAAETAGMQRGDRLVELGGHEVGDIYDFMYVLRQSKPGDAVTAVVERDGERVQLDVVFGTSTSLR